MPLRDWLDNAQALLRLPALRYAVSPLVFLAVLAAGRVAVRIWKAVGARLEGRPGAAWARAVVPACVRPLRAFFLCTAVYALLALFPGAASLAGLLSFIAKVYRTALVVLVAWVFCNLVSTDNLRDSAAFARMDASSKKSVLPLFSKALRFVVAAIAVLVVAQEWNFSVSGLIAGLGVGGLAVSLAAKDLLASMFGGLVILLDKPFRIGDWVEVADTEGTVEDITFRSVRIRTFTQAVVTLPNATVVDSAVTNWSRMGERRVVLKLTLEAQTPPARLRALRAEIEKYIRNRRDVNAKTATVSYDDLTQVGIVLTLVYFTRTTDWNKYLAIREDVLLTVLQILERQRAALALPAQELHLRSAGEQTPARPAAETPGRPPEKEA